MLRLRCLEWITTISPTIPPSQVMNRKNQPVLLLSDRYWITTTSLTTPPRQVLAHSDQSHFLIQPQVINQNKSYYYSQPVINHSPTTPLIRQVFARY